MISWIQRNFQHHFRTIFAVVLGGMIISFIFTIGATPGCGREEIRAHTQPFFGYNLQSSDDQHRIFGDAKLSIFFQYGPLGIAEIGENPQQLESYGLERTATLALADQLHIPAPSEDVLATYVKTLGGFANENGAFDPDRYNAFRDTQFWTKIDPQFTLADVSRVLADNWRSEQVSKLLAGPGYVFPGDIKVRVALADTQWTIGVATADYTSFAPVITPTQAEISKFFDADPSRYNIPPRVSVDYIAFPAADFVPQVTLTDDDVRAYYDAHPGQFPKPANHKTADSSGDFAAVRPQVEAALKLDRAQQLTAQAASDVALALYNEKINGFTPQLDTFLSEHHLTRKALAPFAADALPAELGTSPEVADEAFKLGQDRFFSDALATPAGSVILLWKETLPAYTPLLAEVQAKVTADYKEARRRDLFFNKLGQTIHDQLTARLKAGDTFDKAVAVTSVTAAITAAPATGVKLDGKTFPPFTLRQPPKDLDRGILRSLGHLEAGNVSHLIPLQDKGCFVYVVAKKSPDLSDANPQFASARAELAPSLAGDTLKGSLLEIITKEQDKSKAADTP